MFTSAVHKIFVGYVLTFYTLRAAASVVHEEILNHVLSELSGLKVKVYECDEKLAEMDHRVPSHDDKLRTEFYDRRFAKMEDRLLAAEHNLKSAEKFYKKKIAQMENKLLVTENKLKAFEQLYESLEEMDNRLMAYGNNLKTRKHFNDEGAGTESKGAEEELKTLSKPGNNSEDTTAEEVTTHSTKDLAEPKSRGSGLLPQTHLTKRLLGPAISHRVAFSAYLSPSVQAISELGREHTIPFDKVLLNEGQAFDTVLHAFICPVNGIYMFQSALMSDQNQLIQTELVKDGTPLVRMYAAGSDGSRGYDQGFNSANIKCNNGERVWVRIHAHFGTSVFAWQYSSFSGHILWEI
ncbi:uncharacterized protein LOC123545079 [Mercenaria mercenaria]|uniref:uncharacterized protein LOC123545079 n=1 Tax=Mercenaria mercenaria TaxID=6596 RepID=UPI00234F4445|nr:uncharacterized protein LOC123545079 [Mercenaria mercenaria]